MKWFRSLDNYVEKMPCDTHKWYIYFAPIPCSNADKTMQMLCETVRELPAHIRKEWDESAFREFSIGYHVGDDPLCFQEHLNPETTSMAAELGAGIGIALYPAPHDEGEPQPGGPKPELTLMKKPL